MPFLSSVGLYIGDDEQPLAYSNTVRNPNQSVQVEMGPLVGV